MPARTSLKLAELEEPARVETEIDILLSDADGGGPAAELPPIGLGRPLRIQFQKIYLGPERRPRNLLVTTAAKNPVVYPEGTFCMNLFTDEADEGSLVEFGVRRGSKVIYYSPSATDRRLAIVVQLNFDNFNPARVKKWIDVGTSVVGLPAFLGSGVEGQAVVKSAGAAAKLVVNLIDRLVDPDSADDQFGLELDLAGEVYGGVKNASYVLLVPRTDADPESPWHGTPAAYEMAPGAVYAVRGLHVRAENGRLVDIRTPARDLLGDFPYVLLSIDGQTDDALKKWKPALVTASVAAQFQTVSEDQAVEDAGAVVEAYGDVLTIRSIEKMTAQKKTATADEKKKLTAEIASLTEQIQDDDLRALVQNKAT